MELELRALVLIAALGFLVSCQEAERRPLDQVVATVNGEAVTSRDILQLLDAESEIASQALDDPTWLATRKRQLLDSLVDRKLLEQAAARHGIQVAEEEVNRAYLRLRAEYPGEAFEDLLSQQRLTPVELRGRLRRQLLTERLFSKEVYARIAVTDQEIEAWLEAHPQVLVERPERVRASQIVVKSESEAKAILAELRGGASFAELATKHSLSPDAKVGGDLGWFAKGEMPPPFDEICFSLPPGRISDVVESPYGFHIVLVQQKERAERLDPEERMQQAEAQLLQEKALTAQGDFLTGLRDAATIQVNEKALSGVGTRR